MARKKKAEEVVATTTIKLPKPIYNIGDKVLVDFIGLVRKAEIIAFRQHPSQPRWIYKVKDVAGTIIPWVGINGQEQFANIVDSHSKENLDSKEE